ncbi:MAG: transglutaminase domain-containing protein [Bacteroidota bacterium]
MLSYYRNLLLLGFLCFNYSGNCIAQKIRKEDYFFIDGLVQKAGSMKGYSLQYIVDSISKDCKTELQITRAFYYWQTHFVDFDLKRKRHPGKLQDNTSSALMERRASSEGYARMFKAMCDLKKIDCNVVKGVLRYRINDIGHFDKDEIHFWNVVSINNTSFLIDVSLGVGYFSGKDFIHEFTDAWWLCNRKLFAASHFPDDHAMQLLETPITKTEFSQSPLVLPGAIVAGLIPSKAVKGVLRGAAEDSTQIKFNLAGKLNIISMQISFDDTKRTPIAYDFDEFGFYITVPNGKEGKHSASIYCNNSLAFIFKTEMRRNNKKPNR